MGPGDYKWKAGGAAKKLNEVIRRHEPAVMVEEGVNKPLEWSAKLAAMPGEKAKETVLSGLRMAQDTHPVYEAVNLLIAQHTLIELRQLLLANCPAVEYQRGRMAALIDLHNAMTVTATAEKFNGMTK